MFQQRSRLARGRIDLREPLTDHPLNIGCVGWWLTAPGRYGSNFWWDLVSGKLATLSGVTSGNGWNPRSYPGGFGSLLFNSGASVASLNLSNYNFTNGATVVAWIYPTGSSSNYNYIFGTTNDDSQHRYLSLLWGQYYYGLYGSTGSYSPSTHITANTWNQVAIGASGPSGSGAIFFNGSQVATPATGGLALGGTLQLGVDPSHNTNYVGNIASVKVYNRLLTASDISDDYFLAQQGYPGVLRRRRRVAYSVPSASALVGEEQGCSVITRFWP